MSSNSFWRKLSRLVWDASAPISGRRGSPKRSAPARKARLLVEALEDRFAPAGVYTVTVPGDPLIPTTGTLRWAIGQANANPQSTVLFAISDTVQLAPTPVGNGELVISSAMTINGAGHTVVISGQNLVRVFDITTGVAVNIQNLTIENGLANGSSPHGSNGGGINASASPLTTLTLLHVSLLDNNATGGSAGGNGGAVYILGSVGVYSSLLDGNNATGNGGAVWASRQMVIDSSTLTNNTATNGGATYEDGTTPEVITGTASQTLFMDNTASDNGGGAWANFNLSASNTNFNSNTATAGDGGGVYSATGNVTLTAGTLVSDNFAGNNGGGVWAERNVTSISSYITANQALGTGSDGSLNPAPLVIPSTGSGGGIFSFLGNVIINGGAVGILSASSTGNPLPAGLVFGGNTAGNTGAPSVAADGYGGGISSGADVLVTNCAFVEGNLAMADGGGIWANGNVTITTAFVDTNTAEGNGGGIATGPSSGSTVILLGAFVYSNSAAGNTGTGSGNGGGVSTPAGNIYTEQSSVFLNVASGLGGGLYDGGTASGSAGGAINLYAPTVIDHNTSTGGGGGIYIGAGGVLTMEPAGAVMFGTGISFLPPLACDPTVAPYITAGNAFTSPNLVNDPNTVIISNNLSGAGGGGIDAESSQGVTILDAWVFGNTASSSTGSGGGVLVHNVLDVAISYSTFSSNSSQSSFGGGLAAILDRGSGSEGMFSVSVDDSTFGGSAAHPNRATTGGGVYLLGYDAFFNHVTFNDNQVTSRVAGGGAAIFADSRSNAFLENVLADDTDAVAHANLLATGGTGASAGVISSMGHNVTSDISLLTVSNYNMLNGDIANGVQALAPLAFNGGYTPTYDLVGAGAAVHNGDEVGPITDQNNASRPIGAPSDIGSVNNL